jgi:broad-specificity NMP kinase
MARQQKFDRSKDIKKHNFSADDQDDIRDTAQYKKRWDQPRIIELVGPPGSGKTTVTEILKTKNHGVRVEIFPFINNRKDLPFFAFNLIRLMPDIFRLFINKKEKQFLTKRDIALMTILTGWNLTLKKMASSNDQVIILEEGAICLLAKLYGFGAKILHEPCADKWWHKTYKKWAHTLDNVIVLDTPNAALLNRIRSRELQYEMKEMSDEEACKYLARIHEAEKFATSGLTDETDGPAVFHLDTLNKSPNQIADEIKSILCSGTFHSLYDVEEKPEKSVA